MSPARLPDELVRLIYNLHDDDVRPSNRAIAAQLQITEKAVRNALQRRLPSPMSSHQGKVRMGRPRCTTTKTDAAILLSMKRNRFASNQTIASSFNVSRDTIRRRGKERKLFSRVAFRDFLKKHHKSARRRWCLQNKDIDFRHWFFSDESFFQLHDCSAPQRLYVHRRVNEKYATPCVLPNPVSDRRGLMVWAFITATGKGSLVFVDGTINAQKYIAILQQHLVPYLEDMPLSESKHVIFQQDNARPHSAHLTTSFLQQEGVQTTTWPALSPDLNPIENVWAIMKREVRKAAPTTLPALRAAISAVWEKSITPTLCVSLYASMRSRMLKVLSRHGLR
jgi:transposase